MSLTAVYVKSVPRSDDIQEIVKWTQFIVQEIFREKSDLHKKIMHNDWWSAIFSQVCGL